MGVYHIISDLGLSLLNTHCLNPLAPHYLRLLFQHRTYF
nr:MAG TPA: hypothetical protein [Bacteriophage sp.]